jgi:hypothetical protein
VRGSPKPDVRFCPFLSRLFFYILLCEIIAIKILSINDNDDYVLLHHQHFRIHEHNRHGKGVSHHPTAAPDVVVTVTPPFTEDIRSFDFGGTSIDFCSYEQGRPGMIYCTHPLPCDREKVQRAPLSRMPAFCTSDCSHGKGCEGERDREAVLWTR